MWVYGTTVLIQSPQKTIGKQHSEPQNLVYFAYFSYNGNQAKSYLQNIAYFAFFSYQGHLAKFYLQNIDYFIYFSYNGIQAKSYP